MNEVERVVKYLINLGEWKEMRFKVSIDTAIEMLGHEKLVQLQGLPIQVLGTVDFEENKVHIHAFKIPDLAILRDILDVFEVSSMEKEGENEYIVFVTEGHLE